MPSCRIAKEDGHNCNRTPSERQVDPKAPPPRHTIGQGAPQNRPHDGRDAKHARQQGNVERPLPQRHRIPYNRHTTREQRSGARTRDRAAHDQHLRGGGGGAEHGADLEDDKRGEIGVLDVHVGVDLAERRLQRRGGEQIRRPVPSHVAERVEDGGDVRDRGGDDGVVEGDDEDGEAEAGGEDGELEAAGVLGFVFGVVVVLVCGTGVDDFVADAILFLGFYLVVVLCYVLRDVASLGWDMFL